jgi:glycosyltransferase involved in cell wall biosynthesis
MKILIHALGVSMGGGVRHLENLIAALGTASGEMEFRFLVPEGFRTGAQPANIHVEAVPRRWARFAGRVWFDLIRVPRMAKRNGCDAVVSLLNFGPIWSPVPHVLFQRNSLYFCPAYARLANFRERAESLFRRRLAVAAMRRAAVVVTPSNAMRDMILAAERKLRRVRFRTLYHAAGDVRGEKPLTAELAERFRRARGWKLLYATHPAVHKGFEELFEALGMLKAKGVEFTFFATIGRSDWPKGVETYERRVAGLGLEKDVVFLGRIAQEMMPDIYRAADLMVFPSRCESFGFPMVEAMENGLPIVAADTPTNREICAEAAVYLPPDDANAAADVIARALEPAMLAELKEKGTRRAAVFPGGWDRYVREFEAILEDAVGKRPA